MVSLIAEVVTVDVIGAVVPIGAGFTSMRFTGVFIATIGEADFMILKTVATGSAANCYVLSSNDGESMILDAGVPVRKALPAIPDFRKISGCLVTHEHNDHAKSWEDWCMRGVPVCMSAGTYKTLQTRRATDCFAPTIVRPQKRFMLGNYTVLPFEVQHDAAQPVGYLIQYRITGETLLYATDTYYLKYTFPGVNYWIVECNYCEDLIDGETDIVLRNRLKESHMSLRRLMDALKANDLRETAKIVLVHLSDQRSDERRMTQTIEDCFGIETVAARAGERVPLTKTPF